MIHTLRKEEEKYSKELLLGILLTVAILDHTRLFFHYWNTNPGNLESTTPFLFFTRFISHFFAPSVFFITGSHLFVWSRGRSKKEIFYGLIKLALVLVLLELVVNNFLWTFDSAYHTMGLFIIGALGLSICLLAFLQFLPKNILLLFSILVLIAHHLSDGIQVKGISAPAIIWYITHQQKYIPAGERLFIINYTLIPWFAVLSSGYAIGYLYRRKWLLPTGILLTALFFILRGINGYGDIQPWVIQADMTKTILSFFNVTKYPASADFMCITLGPVFILLHVIKKRRNQFTNFFVTFGSAPLFTYLLSTFVIHAAAMIHLWIMGQPLSAMVITPESYQQGTVLSTYGYPLAIVYLLWIIFLLVLYYCCRLYHSFSAAMYRAKL